MYRKFVIHMWPSILINKSEKFALLSMKYLSFGYLRNKLPNFAAVIFHLTISQISFLIFSHEENQIVSNISTEFDQSS